MGCGGLAVYPQINLQLEVERLRREVDANRLKPVTPFAQHCTIVNAMCRHKDKHAFLTSKDIDIVI